MGKDGDRINPIFLNLMSTLTSRGGAVYIRIGGNTQDKATILADGLEDGQTIEKAAEDTSTVSIWLLSNGGSYYFIVNKINGRILIMLNSKKYPLGTVLRFLENISYCI